jgi:hypothetical protein
MTDERTIDARLTALLAVPDAAPDEAFVVRIERALLAERRMAAARATAWRRFAIESVASAAIVTAFWLLWRLGPAEPGFDEMPIAPSAAAILILFLWFAVELRPAAIGLRGKMPEGL